jgi:hypothetical protein
MTVGCYVGMTTFDIVYSTVLKFPLISFPIDADRSSGSTTMTPAADKRVAKDILNISTNAGEVPPTKKSKKYSWKDVALHNQCGDAWISIRGKVSGFVCLSW